MTRHWDWTKTKRSSDTEAALSFSKHETRNIGLNMREENKEVFEGKLMDFEGMRRLAKVKNM